jgi:hypothetical protein
MRDGKKLEGMKEERKAGREGGREEGMEGRRERGREGGREERSEMSDREGHMCAYACVYCVYRI